MNYTQKMGRRLATLILCLCTLLALFPTTALAATTDITVSSSQSGSSCAGNANYWKWNKITLTKNNNYENPVYTGTMVYEISSDKAYDGSSAEAAVIGYSSSGSGSWVASGTMVTWTFTKATLSELQTMINCSWIYTASLTNSNGATGYSVTDSVSFTSLTTEEATTEYTVTLQASDEDGSGTVKASSGETITANGTKVAENSSITFTLTPGDGSYVSGYIITNASGTVLASEEKLTGDGAKTTAAVNLNQDIIIEPAFTKVEDESKVKNGTGSQTSRPTGSLSWAQTADTLSYAQALAFNYNANIATYLLDGNYGKSWKYGVDPLEDPAMYMTATFASGTDGAQTITVGTSEDDPATLKDIVGTKPKTNINLDSTITSNSTNKSKIKPGTFTQTVTADYYTASKVCPNHWYHVYGVTYHKDGMNRSFTILKDTLTLSGVESSYAYTSGLYDTITGDATLTPATYGTDGTQNNKTLTKETTGVTIKIYDSSEKEVTSIDAAGTYKLVAIYTGNDYIASYTEGASEDANNDRYAALTATFTVELGDNPDASEVKAPTVKNATTTAITLDSSSIVNGQEYSIDGTTWYTAAELETMNYTFSNLTQGTKYIVQTRLPATNQYKATTPKTVSASTLVTVSGTVTAGGTADITKPVTVTFTDTTGKTYTATADDNGSYSLDLPLGTYTVTVTDKDGLQSATTTFTVDSASTNALNVTMKNTAKGDAMVSINKDAQTAKDAIDAMSGLTEEEKTAKKAEIDQAAANAKAAVKAAADDAGVTTALDDFSDALSLIKEKAEALASISSGTAAQTAQAAKDAINALTNLTDAEKNAKIAEIDKALADAKTAVGNAADDAAVQAALAALDESVKLIQSKATAIDGINKDAADAKAAIDKLENLTDAEKTAKKAEIDTAAKTAKEAVDAAADADGITDATKQLAGDLTLIQSKAEAIDDINKKAAAKKAEIDQAVTDGTLSQDDADALKAVIDEAADKAKDAVNKATDQDGIDDALTQFNEDLALIDSKIKATNEIDTAVQAAKDKIDALSSLTAAHKQALKDAIDAAAKTAKGTVNKAATQTEIDNALKTLNTDLDDINDQAVARNFADKYLADGNGSIYTDFDSGSIDKILDAYNAYNALTDKQKALVDAMISKATGGKYTTYAEYRAAAQEAAGSGANKFIENHMTLNGNTVTSVSRDTYDNILGGAADWSKLSQTEKDIVNARLKAAGATQTYEEMLAAAQEAVDKSADDFISKYLGNIYTEATFGNYQQILSGLADWKAMSQSERDAVNAKLMAAIGKTYEMLLAEAQELAEIMAILSVPDTGDDTNFTLLYALLLVGAVGLTGTYACGKRKKYNK